MSIHSDLLFVKKRLTEWGNWCYQIVTMGLGYSRQSLLAKLQADGGMAISGEVKLLIPSNEEAEALDELIELMAMPPPKGIARPEWAKVIRIHYTMQREKMEKRIQSSQLNERTYYRYLKDAQEWLSVQLNHS